MKLKAKTRNALPTAGPGRTYPDENVAHARDALARVAGKPIATAVRAAVHKKYPKIA